MGHETFSNKTGTALGRPGHLVTLLLRVKRNLVSYSPYDFFFDQWIKIVLLNFQNSWGFSRYFIYFKCNSILVREHYLYNFNFLKFIETSLVSRHMINLGESSICRGKEYVFSYCWAEVLEMSTRLNRLIVLFRSSICSVYLLHHYGGWGNKISCYDRFVYFSL